MNQVVTQSQESGNRMENHSNDEIDLLELVAGLWRGRWIIFSTTAIVTLLAGFWINSKPSIYRVNTVIQAPTSSQLADLKPSILQGASAKIYQLNPLASDEVFALIKRQLDSLALKKAFWEKQNNLVVDLKDPKSEAFQAFAGFNQRLKVTQPSPKDVPPGIKLALEIESADVGVTELKAFVDFANTQIRRTLVMQVTRGIHSKLKELTADIEFYRQRELTRLSDRLTQLREALQLAKSLGISDTPYDQISGVELEMMDNRLYMLGTKALQAEIGILESRKDLEPFAPNLRDMGLWKQQMEADLQRLSGLGEGIEVLQLMLPPEATLGPIAPRRMLVLAIAVAFGGITGVFVVLVRHGVKSYHERAIQKRVIQEVT